jgi:DNA-binding NtrC family response regulator
MDKTVDRFAAQTLAAMTAYDWPGNVRELRNAVERSLLSCRGDAITVDDLPDKITGAERARERDTGFAPLGSQGLDSWLEDAERRLITEALVACDEVQAARRLGISERSLWHRVKKLGIQVERVVQR